MNYLRENIIGIDLQVQRLQKVMYRHVLADLGLTDSDYECYGRIYRNEREDLTVPEWYYGDATGYGEVLFNDKVAIQSFFDAGETTDSEDTYKTANASLYVMMQLDLIPAYTSTTQRYDENARVYFENLTDRRFGFILNNIVVGLKTAMKDYKGIMNAIEMKHRNMQPFLVFRLDYVTAPYQNYKICLKN